MDLNLPQAAGAVVPYATALIAAYGKDAGDRLRSSAADSTADAVVAVGHRLLSRILRLAQSRDAVESALTDVANGETDADIVLRLQIRKALAADADLAADVLAMLSTAGGDGGFSVETQHNHGSGIFAGRDHLGPAR